MPKQGHHSSASGSKGGHRNSDSFAKTPFVDLVSLISSLSHHLGQIRVKAVLEAVMGLPGRQSGETPKEACTVADKTLRDIVLSTLTRTCTHLLLILPTAHFLGTGYNHFINFCWERLFVLYPGHQTDRSTPRWTPAHMLTNMFARMVVVTLSERGTAGNNLNEHP